jgi:hypothetical protein
MNTPNETYQKLDRAALWLLIGEFGGAALLLALMILMIVGNLISSSAFDLGYQAGEIIAAVIAIAYVLAYLANLVIGIMGLYFYVSEKREGYPGTGLLLDWILVSTTLWIALIAIALFTASGF